MDGTRFDALARSLARHALRRRALGVVVAAALAPLTTVAEPEPAGCLANGKRCRQPASDEERQSKGKQKKRGKHHRRSCAKCCSRYGAAGANGKPRCSCKPEGVACDGSSQCCSGDCRDGTCTACPPNTVFCPDGCANLQTDKNHCGSCEKACDAGQRCQAGS
ncbi:MAG TPA: hypothetical protein VFI22_00935, partial [Thermomicrobiales bacterium]|nr:hypothetical protein [Thermomicrobiales bacterium]